jgi:hypothetical protein
VKVCDVITLDGVEDGPLRLVLWVDPHKPTPLSSLFASGKELMAIQNRSTYCAYPQECTIERKRVFPTESGRLRLLPHCVTLFHTRGTRPIPSGNCCQLVRKKDPVFDVVAFRYPAQGAGAIEPSVSLVPLVTAECSWSRAFVAFAIRVGEGVGFQRSLSLVTTGNTPRVSTTSACARFHQHSRSAKR